MNRCVSVVVQRRFGFWSVFPNALYKHLCCYWNYIVLCNRFFLWWSFRFLFFRFLFFFLNFTKFPFLYHIHYIFFNRNFFIYYFQNKSVGATKLSYYIDWLRNGKKNIHMKIVFFIVFFFLQLQI